jgi:hypothetical protein
MTETYDWVIVEPGIIVLPTTGYEIRRTEAGEYQAYHNGKKIGSAWSVLGNAKACCVEPHMRDLLAVGIEP